MEIISRLQSNRVYGIMEIVSFSLGVSGTPGVPEPSSRAIGVEGGLVGRQ